MATLNTLRTKFGIVLSAVIAFALLAFIFSLKSEMGFSGNDPIVAKIDGKDVSYTEYQAEYDNIRTQNNFDESDEQQLTALSNMAMQSFVTDYVLAPGFDKLGLQVSEAERLAMISGEIPTQAFYSVFADASTGAYNRDGVNMFLLQAAGNPQAEEFWTYINDQARTERQGSKFISLLSGGVYVNSLEVKNSLSKANESFNGRWAGVRYSSVQDSEVTIENSEVNAYYEKNKARYKKRPTKTISYAKFNIVPTSDDRKAIEETVIETSDDFSVAEDIRGFVRDNRYGSIASNYVLAGALAAEEAVALKAGQMYGPILNSNVWRISRAMDSRIAPDTLGVRVIVLPYTSTDLADSLVSAIKDGVSFAQAAAQHSLHQESAQMGGDIGMVPYSAFSVEIADVLASATENMVAKVEVGDMIQVIMTYNVGTKTEHYKVASIEYPVVASQTTINKAHADAGVFAVDIKGSKNKFEDAANLNSVSSFSAVVSQGDRVVRGIDSSRAIARWAHAAKLNDVSEIFRVDDGYIVAMLTEVDDNLYTSIDAVAPSIVNVLRAEKKAEIIKGQLKGSSFDEQMASLQDAESGTFEGIEFASYYISGIGVEPSVIGVISSTSDVNKVKSVAGTNGFYIFEVTEIVEGEEPLSADALKVGLQANYESAAQQVVFQAMQDMSSIEDLRGMYF